MSKLQILYFAGFGPINSAFAFYLSSLWPTQVMLSRLFMAMIDKDPAEHPIVFLLMAAMHLYALPLTYASVFPPVSDFLHAYLNWINL